MKFHDSHFTWLVHGPREDSALVVGLAGGRVRWEEGKPGWLYSLRILLLVCKVEVLWTTRC